jgi:hypothetical protein
MRPLLRTALASLGCAVLAACADEPTSAPTISRPLRPNLAVDEPVLIGTKVITPCDANALKTDARLYANKSNDVLLTIIGDLGSAVRNGLSSAGNDKAFDGLARMAAIRGTSAQKPGVTGEVFDRLVHRFLGCMQPSLYAGVFEPNPPTGPGKGAGFRQALGEGWVFEVRGKTTGDYADPSGAAFERGSASAATWWGLDKVPGNTWATSITSSLTDCEAFVGSPAAADACDRVLIFGWRTSNFIPSDARAGSSFEHRTLPDVNKPADAGTDFLLSVDVGLCFADASQINELTQRVNHGSKFLALSDEMDCGTSAPTITPTTGSLAFGPLNPMRLAQRAVGFFRPQPLYAASMLDGGSITGRPDDFSPSAVFDLSKVKLVFDTVANTFINTPLKSTTTPSHEVRVYAYSLDAVPVLIPGVDVVVRISGNSSTISFLGGTSNADATITPDSVIAKGTPDGYAKLTGVTITKAGGVQLSARVNVVGVVGGNLFFSNTFNVQNKTAP